MASPLDALAAAQARVKQIAATFHFDVPRLIVVSKTFSASAFLPLLHAGHHHFGENRLQETLEKWSPLLEQFPSARVHFIGRLQTNKVKQAVKVCHSLHTLHSERLAHALADALEQPEARLREVFIQVRVDGAPHRNGVAFDDLDALVARARELKLPLVGLMMLPPQEDNPAFHFATLARLAHEHGLPRLSMGMSHDFEAAVSLGATDLRLGTAVLGARTPEASDPNAT